MRIAIVFLCFTFLGIQAGSAQERKPLPVDVVFCLDLSGSTNGLVDHMRSHLWDYWNFFSHCDPKPEYRIGFVTFARYSNGKSDGYAKVISDLGTDFEKMSSILYDIPVRTEKGEQHIAAALNVCLRKISWSSNPLAKKIIFIVGNGNIYKGSEDIDETLQKLYANNVVVHSIYCNIPGEITAIKGWEKIAQTGGGKISTMSLHNRYFDNTEVDMDKLRGLSRQFNNTYLYYGKRGAQRWKMLQEEDNNIYISNTEGFRFRNLYKISEDYQNRNSSWDLVDLYGKNPVGYMHVDKKYLNDTCKKMTPVQLRSYIIFKKYERIRLAALISELISGSRQGDTDNDVMKKEMPTLEVITQKILRDILKDESITYSN